VVKKYIGFLLFLCLFLFFPTKAFALDNFSTSYDVTYTILESGSTHVSLNVSLTNTTSQYYATSYGIDVGFQNISSVKAFDSKGALRPSLVKGDNKQTIQVEFRDQVVGIGNSVPFTITFDTEEVARKNGSIWEVNIPGLSNQTDFESFNVSVVYPKTFGQPQYTKPFVPLEVQKSSTSLKFTKNQLERSGISIAFGDTQLYDFTLNYHLKNNNLFPVRTEIALPPSTNYQDVFISTIVPQPDQVTIDEDGNWLAQYTLLPSRRLDVDVKGKAELFLYPKKQILSDSEYQKYLASDTYWETQSPEIKGLAQKYKTPKEIYDFVVATLNYDFSRVTGNQPRLGARQVFANPKSAVCLEFNDLFIAIARAAGIPAREVDGFAFTENERQRPLSLVQDVLHAWPQFYDKGLQTWIMIDPTWGNTTGGVDYFQTLDFDHFAFVVKGIDSEYPIPGGGYKLSGNINSKDVHVTFSKTRITPITQFDLSTTIPSKALSSLPVTGDIMVKNTGNTLITEQNMYVKSNMLKPNDQTLSIQNIPPFGYAKQSVVFQKTPFLTNINDIITIQVGNRKLSSPISIAMFVLNRETYILGGVLIGLFAVTVLTITYATWRLPVFRRKK